MAALLLDALGGESGCRRLSAEFYSRVAKDAVLRPLFPGKSLRCATDEFAAFLIQFLGGDENQTQHRWWLSLRESHARFRIGAEARAAWLKHMQAALDATVSGLPARQALGQFFLQSSSYVQGTATTGAVEHEELAERWSVQLELEGAAAAIAAGRDDEARLLAARFADRRVVFIGLLAKMLQTGREALLAFVIDAVRRDGSLGAVRFGGRPLLHLACAAGNLQVVELLLRQGTDANLLDRGAHTPLFAVANECGYEVGAEIVRLLVRAGADANAAGGVTRATALHMAARRGHVAIARTLLECGARIEVRDSKGVTPLERAINCRKHEVARLLAGA